MSEPTYVINPVTKKRITVGGAVFKALSEEQKAQALSHASNASNPVSKGPSNPKSKKTSKGRKSNGWKVVKQAEFENLYEREKGKEDYTLYLGPTYSVPKFHQTQSSVKKLKGVCLWTEMVDKKSVIHAKNEFVLGVLAKAMETLRIKPSDPNGIDALMFGKKAPSNDELESNLLDEDPFSELFQEYYKWFTFYFTFEGKLIKVGTFASGDF